MTAMWFGLAAIALAGAGALLYIDRIQRQRSGRVRQIWAKAQGFQFEAANPTLTSTWRRAVLAKQDYLTALDVVTGMRRGERFVLFDLEETATIVAVERDIGSDVDIDLRPKSSPPPKDTDLELLGAMGDRVVFSTNLEIARRVCDARMVAFVDALPEQLQLLWSEDRWTLGSMPIATSAREWDEVIDAVARFSGILHVLPPTREPRGLVDEGHDPGRPRPPRTVQRADVSGEPTRGAARVAPPSTSGPVAVPPQRQAPAPQYRPAAPPPNPRRPPPRQAPLPPQRPLPPLPPRPVPQRPDYEAPFDAHPDDEPSQEARGGPFHPGFRPYQGPAARP